MVKRDEIICLIAVFPFQACMSWLPSPTAGPLGGCHTPPGTVQGGTEVSVSVPRYCGAWVSRETVEGHRFRAGGVESSAPFAEPSGWFAEGRGCVEVPENLPRLLAVGRVSRWYGDAGDRVCPVGCEMCGL